MNLSINMRVSSTTAAWIDLFNEDGVLAPGGGPAYIASNNRRSRGRGDPDTGAIGGQWRKDKADLRLWRPLYSSLVEQRATLNGNETDVIIQRKN